MKQRMMFILLLLIMLALASDALAEPAGAQLRHIETTMDSPLQRLAISADVWEPALGTLLPIYFSDYPTANDADWKAFFFGAAADSAVSLVDLYLRQGLSLNELGIHHPELEHSYKCGDQFVRYNAQDVLLSIQYRDQEVTTWWAEAVAGGQAEGLRTTSAEAITLAQEWLESFASTVGWSGLAVSQCYAIPRDNTLSNRGSDSRSTLASGFYIVELERQLGKYALAVDFYFPADLLHAEVRTDKLHVYIDDAGIFFIRGNYRNYRQSDIQPLTVTLDDALDILKANMEYTAFSNEEGEYEIRQISLCYWLKHTLPLYDADINAHMEARPVWRFASDTLRSGVYDRFVMFIDAVTGEVLP